MLTRFDAVSNPANDTVTSYSPYRTPENAYTPRSLETVEIPVLVAVLVKVTRAFGHTVCTRSESTVNTTPAMLEFLAPAGDASAIANSTATHTRNTGARSWAMNLTALALL